MTTETAEDLTLSNVAVEEAGPAFKRLTIEVAPETVRSRLDQSIADLVSKASLPGFRPGKAPRRLIEKRYGKALRDDTKHQLLSDAYRRAIDDENLRVLGEPDLKNVEEIELEADRPLTFTVEVEIFPEFEIPSFEDLKVRRPIVEADEDLVEQELTNQCRQHGRMEPLDEETEPGPGHFLRGRVALYNLEEDPYESVAVNPRAVVRWPEADSDGAGALGGVRIENLAEHLQGKGVGDSISVEAVGSENHEIVEIRGRNIRLEFQIEDIRQLIPADREELATQLGCADEADLRARIKDALQAQIATEQREVMHRQIVRYLLDRIEIDLPGRATAAQAERVLQNRRLELMRRNVPEYVVEEQLADLREASDEQAKHDLKTHFVMEKIASEYNVQVEEPEINARIFQMARESGQRPDKVREQIIESNSVNALVTHIRHEKAADRVLEQVEIEDVSIEEWNRLMEEDEAARTGEKTTASTTEAESESKSESE